MKLFYKHIKNGDYNLWGYWVAHNGFGLIPRLKINHDDHGIFFKFNFTWYKLEIYMATKGKTEIQKLKEQLTDNDFNILLNRLHITNKINNDTTYDEFKKLILSDNVIADKYDYITEKDYEALSNEEKDKIERYRTWSMSPVEYMRYKQFCKDHRDCMRREDGLPRYGAIGGGIEVSFMGTGLGNIVHAKCETCGNTYDLTDNTCW